MAEIKPDCQPHSTARPSWHWWRLATRLFLVMLGLGLATGLLALTGSAAVASCAHGVPNLRVVDKDLGILGGGQPTAEGWRWLRAEGITNVVKLNQETAIDSDGLAQQYGMVVHRFPIGTRQQVFGMPLVATNAAAAITPGTFVHCKHGQDRTGLVVALYRLNHGWTKEDAEGEMLRLGFHKQLGGLWRFWLQEKQKLGKQKPLGSSEHAPVSRDRH